MYEYRHLDYSFSNCLKSINKSIDDSSKTKFRHIMSGNTTLRSHVPCVSDTPGRWLSVLTHNILSSIMLSYFQNAHIYAHTVFPNFNFT